MERFTVTEDELKQEFKEGDHEYDYGDELDNFDCWIESLLYSGELIDEGGGVFTRITDNFLNIYKNNRPLF